MKIVIDARFYGTEHTGLGRYTTNVMRFLPTLLKNHSITVLLRKKYYQKLSLPDNCIQVLADFPHYSVREQVELPRLLSSLKCDLYYSFHFNVPVMAKVSFIVTIHDLIKSHFGSLETSTRNPVLFKLKRFGYELSIKSAITKAAHIIVPTNTVKNDILAMFNTDPAKITPVPEAPDDIFRKKITKHTLNLPDKYILFVGNAYPHKNLPVLVEAMEKLPAYSLVIVSKNSPFLERALHGKKREKITVLSDLKDTELVEVYSRANVLVSPSLMEGYGLTGIEAAMVGTPVAVSNIPVYREVYGESVEYFDPGSEDSLVNAVKKAVKRGKSRVRVERTWEDVSRTIAEVVNESCARL